MSLPPRAFYSLNETSARWGCAAADLAGWAATDHLTLVTSIASVICGKQLVAGIVVVSAADMMRMFRRHSPSDEECRIYRIRPQGSVEWQYITEPADGVVIKITDLLLLAEEVQKFEDERDLLRRSAGSPGSAPRSGPQFAAKLVDRSDAWKRNWECVDHRGRYPQRRFLQCWNQKRRRLLEAAST